MSARKAVRTVVPSCVLLAVASASGVTVSWTAPDLDSRTYPFVGQRSNASEPIFGFYNVPEFVGSFDSRDSQIQIGFDTAAMGIPTGAPLEEYQVSSLVLTMTAATPVGSPPYDPTLDDVSTYPLANGPAPAPDADPGRPMTLFGLGFRNGYTALEFVANPGTPFYGPSGEGYGPASFGTNIRHAYPIDFDDQGMPRDVSTNLDEPNLGANAFNPRPLAIGACALQPGATITDGTVFTFVVRLSDPAVRKYVREGLQAGQLGFSLATLHPASGDPSGGSGGNYPFFYMTENGSGAATLDITYEIAPPGCVGDLDGDGDTDVFDFGIFGPAFGSAMGDPGFVPEADFDGNGIIDVFDFGIFGPDFGCTP